MSTMFPEPVAVVEPPAALAVRRKPNRKSWTQASVADLVLRFSAAPGFAATADERAKLIELGLIPKPEKAALPEQARHAIDLTIGGFHQVSEPDRTMGIRYAIKQLQALLPKREVK